jgi:hypothetical protein
MRYDDLIKRLSDPYRRLVVSDRQEAAAALTMVVSILRDYNPDDEFFDDEKENKVRGDV